MLVPTTLVHCTALLLLSKGTLWSWGKQRKAISLPLSASSPHTLPSYAFLYPLPSGLIRLSALHHVRHNVCSAVLNWNCSDQRVGSSVVAQHCHLYTQPIEIYMHHTHLTCLLFLSINTILHRWYSRSMGRLQRNTMSRRRLSRDRWDCKISKPQKMPRKTFKMYGFVYFLNCKTELIKILILLGY